VIRALRAAVGGWVGRGLLSAALVMLLYRRLGGICADMERLAVRFQAGRLWRVAGRGVAVERRVADGRLRAVALLRFPGRFGWLVRAAAHHAAVYGVQLRAILEQPEMVALLQASPQAVRVLRPLCRMLAVETSLLRPRLAGAVEPVVPAPGGIAASEPERAAPRVKVRRGREAVDWGRIPLPRGVLSAARRQGFGRVR
jgi:hypothetical protein